MTLEALITAEESSLVSRLSYILGGDRAAAEDLAQETFMRAWQAMPGGLDRERQRAWLRRAGHNLAIDELRRRSRRSAAALDHENDAASTAAAAAEPDAAREALERLSTHERFVLLLHFEAGFTYAEIGSLLMVSEEAARKRVTRARAAFLRAYRVARRDHRPLVLLAVREDEPAAYIGWLERAGATVRRLHETPTERELALADGLVFTGSFIDIHSSLYGEEPRSLRGELNLDQDRLDLAVMHTALALDLPTVGICRGHQLLNIASGGSLYQDVVEDGLTKADHGDGPHTVRTDAGGIARRILGRCATVESVHHQAVRKVGRRLKVTATSPDGVIETIEREDRRFALGLQWHPERTDEHPGELVAEALVEASRRYAA